MVEQSLLNVSHIHAMLSALSNEIVYQLGRNQRVHLEGIGDFQVTLKCKKDVDPKKTQAQPPTKSGGWWKRARSGM